MSALEHETAKNLNAGKVISNKKTGKNFICKFQTRTVRGAEAPDTNLSQNPVVEELLQFLIAVVDAELLEAVLLEVFWVKQKQMGC